MIRHPSMNDLPIGQIMQINVNKIKIILVISSDIVNGDSSGKMMTAVIPMNRKTVNHGIRT